MNKIAHYLQQHLSGEILTSPDVLNYFSTDESILQLLPQMVVYPRSENDIRKTARFTWQLAEKGKIVPITARGMGTDKTGASLTSGISIVLPAHINRVIELDAKTGNVTAEAGINLDKLQQVLFTHGRFLPPVSNVNKQSTLGGAVSNDFSGRASYKYGPMQEYIKGLRVVLSNGEVIDTGRLSKRELNKKLGLASFEGEIYRALDKLIEDNHDLLQPKKDSSENGKAGFNIFDVKQKDGSFDLSPLFVGAQGTLGVISEVSIESSPHNPKTTLVVAGFANRTQAWEAMSSVNKLKDGPASVDFVDETLLTMLQKLNPGMLKLLDGGVPATLLFFEIDNDSVRNRKKILKKVTKILEDYEAQIVEPEDEEREQWERLRDGASVFLTHRRGKQQAIPVLDDAMIPLNKLPEFFVQLEGFMEAATLPDFAVWGQAGNGLVHVAPLLDITSVGDRQKMFKVMSAYYGYVSEIGGSIAGEYAEGRLRGLFIEKQFSAEVLELFHKVKNIFDPNKTLNPGVKLGADLNEVKSMVRNNYVLDQQYTHLPRG